MVELADKFGLSHIYLPAPGCGNGWLSYQEVYDIISPILDDRFLCVHSDTMKRNMEQPEKEEVERE